MENQLYENFRKHFPSMTKPVHEEELILFLEKLSDFKFHREIFKELTDYLDRHGQPLTPENFFQSYLLAYKLLKKKEKMARDQISRNKIMIDELGQKTDFGILQILDFDLGNQESKLTHFEISVDSIFKIKLADTLPMSLFLP